jgi:hypothetical protein
MPRAILRAYVHDLIAARTAEARVAAAFPEDARAMAGAVVGTVGERRDRGAIDAIVPGLTEARAVGKAFAMASAVARAPATHDRALSPREAKVADALVVDAGAVP